MDYGEKRPHDFVSRIAESRLSIYDPIEPSDSNLWVPTPDLEKLLNEGLVGVSLKDLPYKDAIKGGESKSVSLTWLPCSQIVQEDASQISRTRI